MELNEKLKGEASVADREIRAELAQLRRDLAEISRFVADLAAIQTQSAARTAPDRIDEADGSWRDETHIGDAHIRDHACRRLDATRARLDDRNAALLRGLLTGTTVLALAGLVAGMLRRAG